MKKFLYQEIAGKFARLIEDGTLKTGDKLPSIRSLSQEEHISISSAYQAYIDLENKGLIEARPKSGYYVSYSLKQLRKITKVDYRQIADNEQDRTLMEEVYAKLKAPDVVNLSINKPDSKILPIVKLKNSLLKVIRKKPDALLDYNHPSGNQELRRQIARISFSAGILIDSEDIITTSGCLEAVAYAVWATTNVGDAVAVESPTYFGLFKAIRAAGRVPVEIATDPTNGIDLEALKKQVTKHKIKACIVTSSFSNPIGVNMPEDKRKQLVNLAERLNFFLIEDDIYGEIYFDESRLKACKAFDTKGRVLLCSSLSKTVAPGYRIGWIIPGDFKRAVLDYKLNHSVTTSSLTEIAMADFLANGRYDLHMRSLRKSLHEQSLQYLKALYDYFPDTIRVSQPKGGFVIWVELPQNIDGAILYQKAIEQKVSVAPGQLFSQQQDLHNYFRLSFGTPFSDEVEQALQRLGKLVANWTTEK